ncbi:MAG: gliding motility protein GldL [Bacteroidales bacterium]|nr:gliding motility protein GldL [Bacteroidales bacterium]
MGFSVQRIVTSRGWKNFMAKLYGWGAAIVIVGALFKILHWPGANLMLMIGMFTESIIFFFSAFEPPHVEVDWSIVYPELAFMYEGHGEQTEKKEKKKNDNRPAAETTPVDALNKMFAESGIDNVLIKNLGEGMKKLGENANQMASLSSGVAANEEFSNNLKKASSHINSFGNTIEKTANIVETEFSASLKQSNQNVVKSVETSAEISKKLQSSMEEFMKQMKAGSEQAALYQQQTKVLTNNLAALNNIYGNMLSAMNVKQA